MKVHLLLVKWPMFILYKLKLVFIAMEVGIKINFENNLKSKQVHVHTKPNAI